jgi:hypothetical protein
MNSKGDVDPQLVLKILRSCLFLLFSWKAKSINKQRKAKLAFEALKIWKLSFRRNELKAEKVT